MKKKETVVQVQASSIKTKWLHRIRDGAKWAAKILVEQTAKLLLGSLLVVGTLSWVFDSVGAFFWHPIEILLSTPPTSWTVQSIAIVLTVFLLVSAILTWVFLLVRSKRKYLFTEWGKFQWRTDRKTFITDEEPYCIQCQCRLVAAPPSEGKHVCPNCGDLYDTKSRVLLEKFRECAHNLAIAKLSGHLIPRKFWPQVRGAFRRIINGTTTFTFP